MPANSPTKIFAEHALTAAGWRTRVVISLDGQGRISAVTSGASPQQAEGAEIARGPVVPAVPNVHSHAFQRAMAGLAEVAGPAGDSFWTWREEMYRTVGLLSPDDVEAIAARLFVELLKGGFGAVAEFHYLHHAAGGVAYADRAEMALRIIAAAQRTGIGLTLLPVFYARSNFGGQPPGPGQMRFVHSPDGFASLLEALQGPCAAAGASLGCAIHSLRAATLPELHAVAAMAPAGQPIHIHVAEQQREVADCLAFSGRRPVELLLDEVAVDQRWCLVHATHMTESETVRLAKTSAVAGLCPETEANLGDGTFPATGFLSQGGRFGIGTDSHVATSAASEMRMLEYSQRLHAERRNCIAQGPGSSVGRTVFDHAVHDGARALGHSISGIAPGARADLVVLDGTLPFFAAAREDQILDRWIFGAPGHAVKDAMAGGVWQIRDGRHALDDAISADFTRVLKKLSAG